MGAKKRKMRKIARKKWQNEKSRKKGKLEKKGEIRKKRRKIGHNGINRKNGKRTKKKEKKENGCKMPKLFRRPASKPTAY